LFQVISIYDHVSSTFLVSDTKFPASIGAHAAGW
jgi:hypothetical protein